MSKPKLCPLVGQECLEHECEFYDKRPSDGEYLCRYELTNGLLHDIALNLQLVLTSSETHRETATQMIKSTMLGGATEELEKLTGLKKNPAIGTGQ